MKRSFKFFSVQLLTLAMATSVIATTETKVNPTEEKMMKAWKEAATPGASHEILKQLEGKWETESKWFMGDKVDVSKGKAKNTWMLGDRFLKTEYTGKMNDQDFEGVGFMGYSNTAKTYMGSWMDNMCTHLFNYSGNFDKDNKVLTMKGEFKDPTGKTVHARYVTRIISENEHVFEMFNREVGKKEMKVGEISYVRPGSKRTYVSSLEKSHKN
jgi:hypothetical protein